MKTLYFLYDGETISDPQFMDARKLAAAEEQLNADGASNAYRYIPVCEAINLVHAYVFKECQE